MPFRAPMPKTPFVTQKFGERPDVYRKYGINGHDGVDFRARTPLPVYACFDGQAIVKDSGSAGYGLHVRIRDATFGREVIYGHLSKVSIKDGDTVKDGQAIGMTGNTGASEAPHLHFGLRMLVCDLKKPIRSLGVKDHNNGYFGFIDPLPKLINW